jgi:hypothetical protein
MSTGDAGKDDSSERRVKVAMVVGLAFPVVGGALAAVLGDAASFRVGGAGLAAGVLLFAYAGWVRPDASASAAAHRGGVRLPRRWSHGLALAPPAPRWRWVSGRSRSTTWSPTGSAAASAATPR